MNTNWEIIQHNLYTNMDTNLLATENDTRHGLDIGSSAVCGKEINSNVKQENTRMYIGITFISVEIKCLKWYKKITIITLTTQSVTELLNDLNHSGVTLNSCGQRKLVSRHSEL